MGEGDCGGTPQVGYCGVQTSVGESQEGSSGRGGRSSKNGVPCFREGQGQEVGLEKVGSSVVREVCLLCGTQPPETQDPATAFGTGIL